MLGQEIPLESAGHQDHMRIFKSAAHYCLSDEDLKDILDTKEAELELYLHGIFRAACLLPRYELAAAARQYFELNVFKPASKNKEIQEHLGLEMGQSVFDKYDFWLFCIYMYVAYGLTSEAIRFPGISDPQFCPRPDSKAKKAVDYVESKSALAMQYSASLHYAIGHRRRVDRALPAHSSGRKALDLLDADSSSRCFCR